MTIEEAKERIDLKAVIERFGVSFNASNKAKCPFHEEKDPSFSVKGQRWRCFGCGKSGDVFDFVGLHQGVDFPTAKRLVYDMYGFDYRVSEGEQARRALGDVLARYCEYWHRRITPAAKEYLSLRGFTEEFIDECLIGSIPAGEHYPAPEGDEDRLREAGILYQNGKHALADVDRIVLPWWTHGRIVYLSCRRLDNRKEKKYKNLSLKPPLIGTPRGPALYVTEGVTDTLLAQQQGLNVVGIPGNGLQQIKLPRTVKEVCLVFDNDTAGEQYSERFGIDFVEQGARVYLLKLPAEGMDLADYLSGGGRIHDLDKIPLVDHFIDRMKTDRQKWKPLVYRVLKTLNEYDRADAFKRIKRVTGYALEVIRRDYEGEVKVIERADVFEYRGVQYCQPEGWTVSPKGILYFSRWGVEKVSPQMAFVKNIGQDNLLGKQYVRLQFGMNGRVKEAIYRKIQVADTRELVKLADDGLDVHSYNVSLFSRFLVDFINANQQVYQDQGEIVVVTQLGWHGDQFILPNACISPEGVSQVHYYEIDVKKVGYRKKGTLAGWIDTVRALKEIKDPSLVVFLLYAGFAGAILEKLEKKSIIIHLYSDTSMGKTVSTMFPASIYGYPDTHDGVVIRWENTETFIIRRLEQQKNIPYFLDELSSRYNHDVQSILYQLEGGISKGKASKTDALRTEPQRTWATAVFSTGEPSLLQDRSLGGAMIRTWEFPGMPFREDNIPFVKRMARQLLQNCGQAIEPFLREFFVTRWQEIDTFYPDDNLSRTEVRIRDNMQAVYIAGVIAEKVFDFGFSPRRVVRAIFLELLAEKKKEGSLVERFLSFLRDYYFINKAFFFKVTGNRVEAGGDDFRPALARDRLQARCLGYVFNDVDLGIVRSQFNQVVREFGAGNTERMILKKLKEQDKILYTGEAHIRVKKQIDGESVSLIYFPGFLDNIDDDSL